MSLDINIEQFLKYNKSYYSFVCIQWDHVTLHLTGLLLGSNLGLKVVQGCINNAVSAFTIFYVNRYIRVGGPARIKG